MLTRVTFVGEVGPFVEQIQEQLPQANYQETLPNVANLALWAWDKEADSLHDFVPNYLKRVEAEENCLRITPSLTSLTLNAYD